MTVADLIRLRRVRGPRAELYEYATRRGAVTTYRYTIRTLFGFRSAMACPLL